MPIPSRALTTPEIQRIARHDCGPRYGAAHFYSMHFFTDPEFFARWIGIVVLDICLAGDNALVIAMATRTLPTRQQFWGRMWGTLGAVILRVGFIFIVTSLLRIPLLQCLGGLALIWIAVKLVRTGEGGDEKVREGGTLGEAVGIIIVADVVMSLDNVIAIAATAKGDMPLVIFGLMLSLPLVVWGSGLLARLMQKFIWIVWLGGGVLGYVAADMILKDPWVHGWLGPLDPNVQKAGPILCAVAITALGWWSARRTAPRA